MLRSSPLRPAPDGLTEARCRPGAPRPGTTSLDQRLADEARFFRSWLENPALAGAVSPSGRFLARTMARYVDPNGTGPIIELGPGTGAITEALLERGVAPERLILVEFDPGFCKLLTRRFPGVRVVQGDAYALAATLAATVTEPAAAIVSSLPLLNKPEKMRLALLRDAFDLMRPDGSFIQFTYGFLSPVPRRVSGMEAGICPPFHAEVSPPVWLNLPPARVWAYRSATDEVGTTPKRLKAAQDLLEKLKLGTEKIQKDFKKEFEEAKAKIKRRADQGGKMGSKARPKTAYRLAPSRADSDGLQDS
jgi:phosphatidylethanolamine/phosphatidyl-N-methylethanolamine N-methyltransferase